MCVWEERASESERESKSESESESEGESERVSEIQRGRHIYTLHIHMHATPVSLPDTLSQRQLCFIIVAFRAVALVGECSSTSADEHLGVLTSILTHHLSQHGVVDAWHERS